VSMHQVNRASGIALVILSVIALALVLIGSMQPPQRLPHDEGALARIFQLTIVAEMPVGLLFLASVDWGHLWRSARPLALSGAITILAFALLYRLEH
jgi:hypothetical protein